MKGQRQLNMHIIFESADAVYPKLSKLVCACRNTQLARVGTYETQCRFESYCPL